MVEHVECPLHVARVPLRTDLIQTGLRKDEVKARTLVHQEGQPECVEVVEVPSDAVGARPRRRPLALKDRAAVIQERLKGRRVEKQSPREGGEAHLRAPLG